MDVHGSLLCSQEDVKSAGSFFKTVKHCHPQYAFIVERTLLISLWLFSGSLLDGGVLTDCCSQHADEDQLALRSDLTTVHRVTTSCEDLSLFVLQLPDLKDAEAVQKFFLEEIQLGEELLAQGDYEKGVDHLTNAIAVCGQPQQQTLPPPVFQMLLTKLPSISQRIVSAQSLSEETTPPQTLTLIFIIWTFQDVPPDASASITPGRRPSLPEGELVSLLLVHP
uniref:uncharacterized protein LOC120813324 n=1 Tax=Gasterosteus aculeatus aculeatus TaxID=481459 RepID=UPI001A98E021|nr:uncharacterized protein LOC120813324 [Gasterosteus aculeatus aculeatus]